MKFNVKCELDLSCNNDRRAWQTYSTLTVLLAIPLLCYPQIQFDSWEVSWHVYCSCWWDDHVLSTDSVWQLRGQLARALLLLVRWPCVAHTLVGLETATYRYSLTGRHCPLLYLDRDCPHSSCSCLLTHWLRFHYLRLDVMLVGGGGAEWSG